MSLASTRRGPAVSRRTLVAATGAGLGSLALGGLGFTTASILAQDIQLGGDEGTPAAPPVPAPAPPAGETVEEVAARLGFDVDALVAFVRDEIRYEAYAGILRGANGALWARAGNAADKTVLLGALLDAAEVPHRFASGALDADAEAALTALLSLTGEEAVAAWDAADTAALLHHLGVDELPATPPALDAATAAQINEFHASAQQAVDLALASTDISTGMIGDALSGGGIALPPLPTATLPDSERLRHVWVQIPDGPDWIDVDPSLPEGTAIPAVTEPLDTLPDDWYHHLRIVVAADEWIAGSVARREVVSFSATSADVVDVPVALSMASSGELNEVGLAINQLLTGQKTIYPSIYAGGVTANAPNPLLFATAGGSALDPFGDAAAGAGEGETIAVWLSVEITSPDAEPVVVERPLLDRVPPEDRAAGTVVPERIAPVTLVPTGIGDDTLEQFNVVTVIHTAVGRIPPTDAFVRFGRDEVFGALGILGPALAGFRDMLGASVETNAGYWSYPSAPNVAVFHVTGGNPDTGETQSTVRADLLYRHRASLPLADVAAAPAVHPLVLSGVLDAVAEHMLLAPETRGDPANTPGLETGPTVAGIFAAAAETGTAVRLITASADLAAVAADPASAGYLSTALDAGLVVVVPEAPVDIGGVPTLGWWIVDPATGRTRDQLQIGMASASAGWDAARVVAGGNLPGYSFLTRAIAWVVANSRALACFGAAVAFGLIASTTILGVDPNNSGAVATGGLLGGGAAGAAGGLCLGP